jgi:hypothetical protein
VKHLAAALAATATFALMATALPTATAIHPEISVCSVGWRYTWRSQPAGASSYCTGVALHRVKVGCSGRPSGVANTHIGPWVRSGQASVKMCPWTTPYAQWKTYQKL